MPKITHKKQWHKLAFLTFGVAVSVGGGFLTFSNHHDVIFWVESHVHWEGHFVRIQHAAEQKL